MKKIKININRPKPDSSRVAAQMNFDELLRNYREHRKGSGLRRPFMLAIAALLLVFSSLVFFNKNKPDSSELQASIIKPVLSDSSKKSVIKPLIPGMKINESEFACDVQNGDTLNTPGGATIIVPANAFVDGSGRQVKDSVTILFREYYDPLDFACSGIPMTYDSAGKKWIFESSGMCDIQGFRNGVPVHINMATPLSITMPTKFGKNDPNLYRMDSTTGVWTYIGKPLIKSDIKGDSMPQNELVISRDLPAFNEKLAGNAFDNTAIAKNIDAQIKSLEKDIAALPVPKEPAKQTKGRPHFTIDVKPSEFPELSVYKEVVFEVTEDNKDFSNSYYNVEWNNTELQEIESGSSYRLILERDGQVASSKGGVKATEIPFRVELIVRPVLKGAEYDKHLAVYAKKFEEYKSLKEQKERQIAERKKKLADEREAFLKRQMQIQARLYNTQPQNELAYWNVRVSFEIDKFGIYNSDRPVTYEHPANVVASFSDDKNDALNVENVYVLQLKQNSLMAWYFRGCCNHRMEYDPESDNIMFTVLPDSRIAWLSKVDFKKLPLTGKADIALAVSDRKFDKIEDMKKYIGL